MTGEKKKFCFPRLKEDIKTLFAYILGIELAVLINAPMFYFLSRGDGGYVLILDFVFGFIITGFLLIGIILLVVVLINSIIERKNSYFFRSVV